VNSKVALPTTLPSAPFNCVVIFPALDCEEDVDVAGWLLFGFVHAPNGATAIAHTAAATVTSIFDAFFMG
jgi:hypothetical protein